MEDRKIYIVFDGPPSHDSGRFVEVEDADGTGLGVRQTGAEWTYNLGDKDDRADFWYLGPFSKYDPDNNPEDRA